ncbi:flagellar biosynthesis anti-sigma factor FlgM [Burkholderia sp. 22PA0099]|uniref:flagellar biosynthesis anti-sigma factor FlgM n=1 Tax=Burkholderia sp. 22PA0099 TaxID=3237372 RepID=UPI0039C36297
MRITPSAGHSATDDVAATARDARPALAPAARGGVQRTEAHELRDAGLMKAAHAAQRAMPAIDTARVEQIRAALAAGEMPFDAGRLAAVISRFHGGSR